MRPGLHLAWMVRESRGSRGRLAFFVVCLAIGVAAVVAVAGLSDALQQGLRVEARKLLAADFVVSGRQPLPERLDRDLAELLGPDTGGWRSAEVKELASVVAAPGSDAEPGPSRLAELKAVAGGYPFYGELRTEPAAPTGATLDEWLGEQRVLVGPALLGGLGLAPGDELLIGGLPFEIVGVVSAEPDRIAGSMTAGPRVFLSIAGLERSGLERFGSRISYGRLVEVPRAWDGEAIKKATAALRERLGEVPGLRVETYAEAQPALRRGIRRVERFLGLVALLSLLLGGVGAAQTTRSWLAGRMDAIAVLRCLGLRPGEVLRLYLAQAAFLGLAGSLLGAAAGSALVALTPGMLGDLLPVAGLDLWQPAAIGRGLLLGTAIALLFSLPPLLGTRRVPPLRVLRKDVEGTPPSRWGVALTAAALVAGTWTSAVTQSGSWRLGSLFTGGVLLATLLLAAAALALIRLLALLRRRRRDPGGGPAWAQHGLAALGRPGAATIGAIVALGVGVLLILGLHLVERNLAGELLTELPADAPSAFLIDIQPHQWPAVRELLTTEGAERIDSVPVVTARLSAIGGRPISELVEERPDDRGRRWALTREQRLTYLERLPADNRIVAGALWSDPQRDELSVEQEFAEELALELGSELVFDLQGVPLALTTTSLRSVDWQTFGINFYLVVEPGVLDEAPQSRVAAVRLPSGRDQRAQDLLAARFPNITLLRIRDFLDKVIAVIERLATAVRFLGGFTVLAGIVILAGAVSARSYRRGREIALLKTLGMTRPQVAAMLVVEYALTGAVAGLVGSAGGVLLADAVLRRGFEMEWTLTAGAPLVALALSILLTAATGVAASWSALRRRPIEVLRDG